MSARKETAESAYERGYVAGRLAAVRDLLSHFIRDHYGMMAATGEQPPPPIKERPLEIRFAELESQRLAAIAALRDVCAEHGDNDWPDDLHLADIIQKHLARHL